jgi:hypothetical protein
MKLKKKIDFQFSKLSIREIAVKGLAELYAVMREEDEEEFERLRWIPNKILGCYYQSEYEIRFDFFHHLFFLIS